MSQTAEKKTDCTCTAKDPDATFPKLHATDCPEFTKTLRKVPRFDEPRGEGRAFEERPVSHETLPPFESFKKRTEPLEEAIKGAEARGFHPDFTGASPEDPNEFIQAFLDGLFGERPAAPVFDPEAIHERLAVNIPSLFAPPTSKLVSKRVLVGYLSTARKVLSDFDQDDTSVAVIDDLLRLALEEIEA